MHSEVVKVMLYSYPFLAAFREAAEVAAGNKAVLSYKNPHGGLDAAADVLAEVLLEVGFEELAEDIGEAAESLDGSEYALIARYYRWDMSLPENPYGSKRSYFRAHNRILKKLEIRLSAAGWTDKRFLEIFGRFPPFVRLLRTLMTRRPAKKLQRSSSGGGFLPLSAKKPAARTAATARRMRTIRAGEEVSATPDTGGETFQSSFLSNSKGSLAGIKPKVSP